MKMIITLTPSESKRLIGRAVAGMDMVQKAWSKGRVYITNGTTNAFVLEELTETEMDKSKFAAGIVCHGVHCVTPDEERMSPRYYRHGKEVEASFPGLLDDFSAEDVIIKGGNAVDPQGNVGIMLANPQGGTIGHALGRIAARGIPLVLPVGLEKLIPSVRIAASLGGIDKFEHAYGKRVGLIQISNGQVITELEAFRILAGVSACHFSSGGVGESQGAVTLVLEGEEKDILRAKKIVASIKGEAPLPELKMDCSQCKECSQSGINN